jgi:hypothetical protein
MESLPLLTQIAYIPMHAEGNVNHKDVEFGFTTTLEKNGWYFCRFFSKQNPKLLRTVANNEGVQTWQIIAYESRPQQEVIDIWNEIQLKTTTFFGDVL